MNQPLDQVVFYDELGPEERERLHAALREDPSLRELFAAWQELRAQLRRELEQPVRSRELLVLYALAGEPEMLTSEERALLESARPALEAALGAQPALQDVVRRIREERADFDAAWKAHAGTPARPAPSRPAARRGGARPATAWVWRVAAMVAVAAFSALLYQLLQQGAGLETIRAEAGQVRAVRFEDGTTVRLMGGSTLAYRPAGEGEPFDRQVRLEGQALFEVARSTTPFAVKTANAVTTVLGTTFGVRADGEATEVVLASGSVALASAAAPGRGVVLKPGEMSRVAGREEPSAPAGVNLAEALGWTGIFFFRAEPLGLIADRLSEFYHLTVTVDPSLRSERVTGTFEQARAAADVLGALAATLGAEAEPMPGGGYHLRPAR